MLWLALWKKSILEEIWNKEKIFAIEQLKNDDLVKHVFQTCSF